MVCAIACAPCVARAGEVQVADPAAVLVSRELPPLWQGEAGTPRHLHATGPRTLGPLVATSLPEDAAWEAWVGPGVEQNSPRGVEFMGKLYLTASIAGHARGGVVAWDGTQFEATPTFPGGALVLGVWNDRLIVATGTSPIRILALNGAAWDTLGHPNSYVNAIGAHGADLVIGGQFTSVDGVTAKGIARFNGSTWSDMGSATFTGSNIVFALCEHAGNLVMAGQVPSLNNIAIWDDVGSSWQTPGPGFNFRVKALDSNGAKLYAAGDFTLSGATPMVARAEWNGSTWKQIPTSGGVGDAALAVWNGGVVVKGGVPLPSKLGFWNGSVLTPMTDSIGVASWTNGGGVVQLLNWGGRLVATGNFVNVGAIPAPCVAIFDGTSWTAPAEPWTLDMLSPEGAPITDLVTWNDQLIAGGSFALLAERDHYVRTVGVGSWDGTHWSPLAGGVFANQRWFGTYQGDLVLTGWGAQARTSGGTTVNQVLRWNGTSWSGFGTPPFDFGFAIQEFQGDLYVGFEDYIDLEGIRRWNGSSWTSVGGGLFSASFGAGFGDALTALGDSLVVGGAFETAGGLPAANVAFWDGASWHDAGAGLDSFVHALAVWNGHLIAGGAFTHSGAQAVEGCAVWDGSSWQPFGTSAVEIEKLLSVDGMLFAAGDFRLPDDSVVETVARWNGSDWHILGSGTNTYAIAVHGGYLYSAGAGLVHGHVSHGLSRIPLYATLDAPRPGPHAPTLVLTASPNPSRGRIAFAFTLPAAGRARLTVVDVAGRIVATLADGPFDAGEHQARWTGAAPAGVYFARLEAPGGASRVTRVVRFE